MDAGLLRGNLELILLAAIGDREAYGLEIANRARMRSAGYFTFSVGSLYPALHRMERDGLVTIRTGPAPAGGGVVKFYRLTDAGRRALALRRREFRRFSKALLALATDAAP
ncbi:PadR family transcriptional regulator [Luedemannella helvata]|uniref:PadR family transcriptional regulator n=1 Tax=Luedemannella helvata TaxID=349315 RepID=A0ABN2KA95_9ACTN